MINVVNIDDEELAVYNLANYLSKFSEINLIGSFTKISDFLDCLRNNEVHLVFLDIEMPELNGLELAAKLIEEFPTIQIVFVTAYNEYAVDAFELEALDYVLKPINEERLQKTIEKVLKKFPNDSFKSVRIRCLGGFEIIINDKVVPFKYAKAREVLAYLIHNQGKSLGWMAIADEVWPDTYDDKKLMNNFHVACFALRSFLSENGISEIFEYGRNLYKIDESKFTCDYFELLETYKHFKKTKELLHHPSDFETGEYFENQNYVWSIGMADKVSNMIKDLKKANK